MSEIQATIPVWRDFQSEVTHSVVSMLQRGDTLLQQGYETAAGLQLQRPINGVTGRSYFGSNALHLMLKAPTLDPRWVTAAQASAAGWTIDKDKRGVTVEYWERPAPGQPQGRVYHAALFHATDVKGMPAFAPQPDRSLTALLLGRRILSGVGVEVLQDRDVGGSFYSPSLDMVHTRKQGDYPSEGHFISQAVLGSAWSLGRNGRAQSDLGVLVGTAKYAKEDLQAHMATLLLAAETGLPFSPSGQQGQAKSWAMALSADKFAFFGAAREAERVAGEFLSLGWENSRTIDHDLSRGQALPQRDAPQQDAAEVIRDQVSALGTEIDTRIGFVSDRDAVSVAGDTAGSPKRDGASKKPGRGKGADRSAANSARVKLSVVAEDADEKTPGKRLLGR